LVFFFFFFFSVSNNIYLELQVIQIHTSGTNIKVVQKVVQRIIEGVCIEGGGEGVGTRWYKYRYRYASGRRSQLRINPRVIFLGSITGISKSIITSSTIFNSRGVTAIGGISRGVATTGVCWIVVTGV